MTSSRVNPIEDNIARYYLFYAQMSNLKATIERMPINEVDKANCVRQLGNVEEGFIETQEWNLPRQVGDVRLGLLGTGHCEKSKLLQQFLQHDSIKLEMPREDGRCKCKLNVDDRLRLVLIREATGLPSVEFTNWVDALILVFSYTDESTIQPLGEIYRTFKEERGQDVPVVLVGTTKDNQAPAVKESTVKKLTDKFDKAIVLEAVISDDVHNEDVFIHACRLALEFQSTLGPVVQGFPLQAPPQTKKSFVSASSPLQTRKNKRMSRFLSSTKASYTLQKDPPAEIVGTGRDIPRKEGEVKKGGKKKYLVCGSSFISYYPSHNDYCKNINEKGVCLDKIMIRNPDKRPMMASRSKDNINGSQNASGTTSPNPELSGHGGISPSSTEMSDLSSINVSPAYVDGEFVFHSRNNSVDSFQRTGPSESNSSKTNGDIDKPITLQEFHDKRQRIMEVPLQSSIKANSGSSTSLNNSGQAPLDFPRSNTLSTDIPRRLLTVDEPDHTPSSSGGTPKKGSIRLTRGHKRGKSWGGSKGLDSDLGPVAESTEFHIVNSDNKAWVFEASSVPEKREWIKVIEQAIKEYISASSFKKEQHSLCNEDKKEIQGRPGNDFCADCNATKPEWASLNLGCLLCINCSGVHRNLGAHISKVRSLGLDAWRPEFVTVMLASSNQTNRNIYEAKTPSRGTRRPIHSASREEREAWIRAKYEKKEFLADLPSSEMSVAEQLMNCVGQEEVEMKDFLLLMAHATSDDINYQHKDKSGRAVLHVACVRGHASVVQILLWNGADLDIEDEENRTPLTYARYGGHADCAEILLHNGCRDNSFEQTEHVLDFNRSQILQASVI